MDHLLAYKKFVESHTRGKFKLAVPLIATFALPGGRIWMPESDEKANIFTPL